MGFAQAMNWAMTSNNYPCLSHLAETCVTPGAHTYFLFNVFYLRSVIMEEAGQVLEIETLIHWILQNSDTSVDACRLKRVILIGDHFQVDY